MLRHRVGEAARPRVRSVPTPREKASISHHEADASAINESPKDANPRSSLRTVSRRSSGAPAPRSLCVLGELLQAVWVQAERDLPAQSPSASLSQCELADQHVRAADRAATVVAHILFAPNQSHNALPRFSVI